jgi:hypothetical protein
MLLAHSLSMPHALATSLHMPLQCVLLQVVAEAELRRGIVLSLINVANQSKPRLEDNVNKK